MIRFSCDGCGKTFVVPDEFVGRKAKCKACGAMMVVPDPGSVATDAIPADPTNAMGPSDTSTPSRAPAASNPAAVSGPTSHDPANEANSKIPVRTRRLMAEARQVAEAFAQSQTILVTPAPGAAPESYAVVYRVRGLEKTGPTPTVRQEHRIEIELGSEYPRMKPQCRILTPIFHPNFDQTTICVGDHWTAGERLVDLIVRIGEMIAFQDYNIKSPLNGEAAMWTDLNRPSLPIDPRPLASLARG